MTSAYRTPTLTPPVAPPLWQRAVARLLPDIATEWKWFRERVGGRWCVVDVRVGYGRQIPGGLWTRIAACPFVTGSLWVPELSIYGTMTGFRVRAHHDDGRCTCEVYP